MPTSTVTASDECMDVPAPTAPAGPPAASPLLILGTPFAAWLPLAEAVHRAVDSAVPQGEFAVRVDPDGQWVSAPHATGGADARYLILVDSPRRALAHWLTHSVDGTAEGALRRWCEGARRLLRHAHTLRARSVLVDAQEAAAAPALLATTLAGWLGLSIDGDAEWTTPPGHDPLADLLADESVRGDREAGQLYAELLASCVAWDDDAAPTASRAMPAPERTAPLERYRALQALALAQRPLAEERAELLVKLHETQDTLHSLHGREQATQQELARVREQLQALATQHDDLARQLEDERAHLATNRAARAEDAAAGAAVQRDLAAAREDIRLLTSQIRQVEQELETRVVRATDLQRQLTEAVAARDTHATQRDALAQQAAEQLSELAAEQAARSRDAEAGAKMQRELAETRQEGELLLSQLHQVQEELETWVLREQDAQRLLAEAAAERDSAAARHVEVEALLAAERTARIQEAEDASRLRHDLRSERESGGLLQAQLRYLQEELQTWLLRDQDTQRQLTEVAAERDSAIARHDEIGSQLATERDAHAQEDQRSKARLQQARQQLRDQLQLTQDAQDRLAAAATDRNSLAQRLDVMTAQQDALAVQCRWLENEVAARQARIDTLTAEALRTVNERDSLQIQTDGLKRALDESSQRVDLLVRDLQQESEDNERLALEVFHLREAAAPDIAQAASPAAVAQPARSPAHAASTFVTQVRDAPPYRHLEAQIDDLHVAGRHRPVLTVRLVEHLGRPGLVVFGSGDAEQALSAWQPSGDEEGRPYVLLVPSDAPGQKRLEGMGTADWVTVNGIATLLQDAVSAAAATLPAHWPVVAARLVRQLQAMPPRLRYDTLETMRTAESGDGAEPGFDVTFGGVLFGLQDFERLHLRWRPRSGSAAPALEWLLDADAAGPPLADWPVNDDGTLQSGLALPVDPGLTRAQQRAWWARWTAADQALVLAVLDALPAAARHLPEEALPAGLSHDALAALASRSHREARRALTGIQLRQTAGSMVRRLRLAT